ncbi:cytidine deaminase [Paraferrimonas haliotis]|uniref:Cytidine deaminase n=1 Tax=Paraferrimonas haliotis TaxID=2013866 RepID=A0AA37TS70_9GAMM|nr:cytidine deaminase [Paraferrimonas haliotis]GLS84728.1 cytidine deaminase [Paraferrimonas haliotis]
MNAQALALNNLPLALAQALEPILQSGFQGYFTQQQVQQLCQVQGCTKAELFNLLLPLAASYARAPISGFHVGAIAEDQRGYAFFGANYEIPGQSLNHSLHAEQAAINHAWNHGASSIKAITINATPCGHCRQFMNELVDADKLGIAIPSGELTLAQLLPHGFKPGDLGVAQPFLSHTHQSLDYLSNDPLLGLAVQYANRSYSPYTNTHSAIAVSCAELGNFAGSYVENAAFNPSLMPAQAVLSELALNGISPANIVRAVLVESQHGAISLANASMEALHSVTNVQLEHLILD